MSAVVNLTELAETRAKMTPGDYQVGAYDYNARTSIKTASNAPIARLGIHPLDEAQDEANARGLAAEHNAIGVLIEVARAAKEREVLEDAWAHATSGTVSSTPTERREIHARLDVVRKQHRAALAKVSL